MATEPHPFERVFKRFLILLALFALSPTVLNLGFKALKNYKSTPENLIAYTILIIGGILIIYTVYFGIKTITLLLDTLFRK